MTLRPLHPRVEPRASARHASLRYVSDDQPGIRRLRAGKSFRYTLPTGKPLRRASDLARIRALVLPPAWTDVWICGDANGHLQASGRDARGRKQYRYHARWREVRDESKFERMIAFGEALPKLRARTQRDLARRGLPREKVLAAVVQLLEKTLIRVGNEEYARANRSYGLTTLRDQHVQAGKERIRFAFLGKSKVRHTIDLHDRRLARVIRRCRDVPGQQLFQYLDEAGRPHGVGSGDVNEYLARVTGQAFTAKDFRTWAATLLAARTLRAVPASTSLAERNRAVVSAIDAAAQQLGTTRSVTRKCYVHPAVVDAFLAGSLGRILRRRIPRELRPLLGHLPREERRILAFLYRSVKRRAA